jgi:predicted DNA-binding transcriptional regulator YafY
MRTKNSNTHTADTDRLLLILHQLLQSPCTPNELLTQLKQAGIEILPDTLYRDINKLRHHGYQIPKATKGTQGQYVLEKVPFCLPFTKDEMFSAINSVIGIDQNEAGDRGRD